jgi:phage tail sheath protein FI
MDGSAIDDNITTAVDTVSTIDSNYAGCYYPWVKGVDGDNNKSIWLPPSVAVVQAFAYNDRTGAPWFAAAGLNRAGLPELIDTRVRLNNADRDNLYLGRVNPIVYFTKEGITVWGQKTLQSRPSALDRINVRRLLITTKKFIASASKYLVFEQNTTQTRQRFLNIVNPYLESIQQRNGLYAFKVKMDDSNNTPEMIDRNMLIGEIHLQPTKTAEFIVIDFNVLPTGAAFPA